MKNTIIALFITTFLASGCKHYAPFPELEGEGELVADQNNVAYDDSSKEENKVVAPASVPVQKAVEKKEQPKAQKQKNKDVKKVSKSQDEKPVANTEKKKETVKKEAKPETQKDLTKPDLTVEDTPEKGPEYVVSEKAPSVITDIDLKEMDAADTKTKVIKPNTKTTTILATKKVIKEEKAVSQEPSVFYLAETIYFANGSSTVDSGYYKKLRQIIKEAKAHKGKIIVQGFSSSRTKNTDIVTHKMANLKVSVTRAENVAKILAQFGMPRSRIITEGLSDSRPVYQEVMPEGERLNRRAEVYISY